MGEPAKASDWFIQAGGGVDRDQFLIQHLFNQDEASDTERLQVLYFLKIIALFQSFGYDDYVIELAKTALDICNADDPNRVSTEFFNSTVNFPYSEQLW